MLQGNGTYLNCNAGRLFGGGAAPISQGNYQKVGAWRNVALQDLTTTAKELIGYPTGYSGQGWFMPIMGGELTSLYNTDFGFDGTASALSGFPIDGTTDFGFTTAGTGGLVSTVGAGDAPATFGFTTNTPDLTASISGDGTAAFGFTTNTPLLGALGGMIGTGDFGFTADWTAYATGSMEGTTAESGVTVDNIVSGVWSATASEFNDPGTTGNKLNNAASAGDPWGTELPGTYLTGTAGYILGNLDAEALADAIMTDPRLLTVAKFLGLK